MKNFTKYLLLASLLLINLTCFAQKPGTPDYLLVKRGFKIFKLGATINNYKPYVRLISDGETKRYEITDQNLLSVGDDIQLNNIVIDVKDEMITDIYVLLDRKYNEKFLATLIAAYGMGETPNDLLEAYLWSTSNKKIELKYYDKYVKDHSMSIFSFVNTN